MRIPTSSIFQNIWRARKTAGGLRAFATASGQQAEVEDFPDGWNEARPKHEIPGPSRFELIRLFAPGGKLHNADALSIQKHLNSTYGTLAKMPGLFGQREIVYSFDPAHFERIFRTEGVWPARRNIETFRYYRRHIRPEPFQKMAGLVSDHGEPWYQLRTVVNPLLMSPKIVKSYAEGVDQVAREFVERMHTLRDANGEMPADFIGELSLWALESIGLIALDRRLNVMSSVRDKNADRLVEAIGVFFRIGFELETKPSLWRYISTRKFRKLIGAFDAMTDVLTKYIDIAMDDLQRRPTLANNGEISMLQRLLETDKKYAFLMTFDMMFAGVDTTSAAMATLLYRLAINPVQQQKLRDEFERILPNTDDTITKHNMDRFSYFRACVKESMRLQPQVPGNMRSTGQNLVLDGYRIPKNSEMFMANNLLQTSSEHFSDSQRFVPERWLRSPGESGQKTEHHPFVYLPFGFGPRTCIGKRFAEMEMLILTSRILREFRIEWHHEPMQYVNAIIITTASDLKLKMIPISSANATASEL